MNSTQSPYNTAALRRLLLQAFSDEEFTIFCYDHFREVRQQFTTGMTFLAKTQLLIEHCERTNAFPHLLPLLAEANPAKYTEFADSLQKSTPQSATGTPSAITNPQLPISNLQSPLSLRQPFEPEMILIPAGEFLMGSDPSVDKDAKDNEQPQHRLYLPDYYLAKTPITNVQYLAFVRATGYKASNYWRDSKFPTDRANHPAVVVSWYEAIAYCNWLAEVTGRAYTLPSEAEWEKGARGTDGRIYPWGNEWDANRCNSYESGLDETTPVGVYPGGTSPYNLLDMAGNVSEWTRSLWGHNVLEPGFKYPYRPGDGRENLKAGDEVLRVLRGGSWNNYGVNARCASRNRYNPDLCNGNFGFRIVVSASGAVA
ncbi:MAG: SUMF1/EgtB/PvdO family nonheme iron enzyme [Anaerolineae bacterium]